MKQDYKTETFPDLKKEISYFVDFSLDEVVEFKPYSYGKEIEIGNVILKGEEDSFNVKDKEKDNLIILPNDISYTPKETKYQPDVLEYPLFGISCLGVSHGFDPKGSTSGFIFWINHRAIIVDPTIETIEWLHEKNISHNVIDGVILTHTHADHDVGILRLLIESKKNECLKIYTTLTIINTWLKKYSIVTGIEEKSLQQLFDFEQVIIGETLSIEDAKFDFHYTLHSVPTIGFLYLL